MTGLLLKPAPRVAAQGSGFTTRACGNRRSNSKPDQNRAGWCVGSSVQARSGSLLPAVPFRTRRPRADHQSP
jgi:hypothetical protein